MFVSINRRVIPEIYAPGIVERPLLMDDATFGGRTASQTWSGLETLVYVADTIIQPGYSITLAGNQDLDIALISLEGCLHPLYGNQPSVCSDTAHWVKCDGPEPQVEFKNFGDKPCHLLQLWFLPEPSPQHSTSLSTQKNHVYHICSVKRSTSCLLSVDLLTLSSNHSWSVSLGNIYYFATGSAVLNGQNITAGDLLRGLSGNLVSTQKSQILILSKS